MVNAYRMREVNIEKNGNNSDWLGWPEFIRKAMKRCGVKNNSITDGSSICMGFIRGSVKNHNGYIQSFRDGDWIVEDPCDGLRVYKNFDFNNRFTSKSRVLDSTMPPEGLIDSIEINESPKIGVKTMSYIAAACPDCKQVYSVLEPVDYLEYESRTTVTCICGRIFNVETK